MSSGKDNDQPRVFVKVTGKQVYACLSYVCYIHSRFACKGDNVAASSEET
jgi:hypothetical protein